MCDPLPSPALNQNENRNEVMFRIMKPTQDRIMKRNRNLPGKILCGRVLFIWLLIMSHLMLINGCMTTRQASVQEDQIPESGTAKIRRVILKTGEIVVFDADGGRLIEKTTVEKAYRAIVGVSVEGKVIEIDPILAIDVQIETKSVNIVGSILLGLGVASVAGAIVLIEALSHIH
jgi:hypothetical protein